jgi:hypothetical protein
LEALGGQITLAKKLGMRIRVEASLRQWQWACAFFNKHNLIAKLCLPARLSSVQLIYYWDGYVAACYEERNMLHGASAENLNEERNMLHGASAENLNDFP